MIESASNLPLDRKIVPGLRAKKSLPAFQNQSGVGDSMNRKDEGSGRSPRISFISLHSQDPRRLAVF